MANNRIIYATVQLSIKDNRVDPTSYIAGSAPDRNLDGALTPSTTAIQLDAAVSGIWPVAGMVAVIPSGTDTIELIRYTGATPSSGLIGVERGAAGTTAVSHADGAQVAVQGWEVPFGVQSAAFNTSFNLDPVFQLGQLDEYENVEGIPEIEVTSERVLDGTKPFWLMVTDPDFTSLKGRTATFKADIALSVYPDVQDSATGTPDRTVVASGMFISSWGVAFPTDGNFTETMTLVGNDKTWGGQEGTPSGIFATSDAFDATIVGSGVLRSENFDVAGSTLPADVPADEHLQSIEVAVDITREDIFELGRKTPFFRAVQFPVTVTTTFEAVSSEGDLVDAIGDGSDNLTNRTIILATDSGLTINLGTKNRLASVSFDGFDAGGGNGTTNFEFTNSNALTITHTGFPGRFDYNPTSQ